MLSGADFFKRFLKFFENYVSSHINCSELRMEVAWIFLFLKRAFFNFAGPLEIVPQVNLDALNRFLVDPINAAANAKIDALNDLGLAAGNIGNILSSNIIDTANAQVNNAYRFP